LGIVEKVWFCVNTIEIAIITSGSTSKADKRDKIYGEKLKSCRIFSTTPLSVERTNTIKRGNYNKKKNILPVIIFPNDLTIKKHTYSLYIPIQRLGKVVVFSGSHNQYVFDMQTRILAFREGINVF